MNYSNVDQKRRDVVMSPEDDDDFIDTDKFQRKFGHKQRSPIKSNGNISNKRGAVSFNIGRIMPRNMTQDKQFLYEQNIKLKQSVQQFRQEVTKLKTRLSATEKQKLKIVEEFNNSDVITKNPSSRVTGHRSGSMSYSNLQSQNYMKKMLRESKDQINLLKNENAKLKKTVKYTEIGELQVQNKHLIDECSRLGRIIESKVLDQNQYADSFESKIEELKQELKQEKQKHKSSMNQTKKKNEQIEQLKSEINQLNLREKKLKRQLAEFKKSSQNERKRDSSNKNLKSFDEKECDKCAQLSKQLKSQKQKVKHLEQQLQSIKTQNKESKSGVIQQKSNNKPPSIKNSTLKINTENQSISKTNGKGTQSQQKQAQAKENKDKSQDNEYNDQFDKNNDDEDEDEYEQKFEKQQVVEQKAIKPTKKVQTQKQQQKQKDEYEEEFDQVYDDNSEKEEILFDNKNNKNTRPYLEVIKETISYRLMSQRYSHQDLSQDIKESGMQEFTVEQLASMLNDQPFFLTQQQIQYVLSQALGRQDLHLDQKIKTKQFIKKIKPFISDFTLLSQNKQQECMQRNIQKLQSCKNKLKKKWQGQTKDKSKTKNSSKTVTKQQFVQQLKQLKFTKDQIQLLIGEACLVSLTIDQINYNAFLDKLCQ